MQASIAASTDDAEGTAAEPSDPSAPRSTPRRRRVMVASAISVGIALLVGAAVVQVTLLWESRQEIVIGRRARLVQDGASQVMAAALDAETGQRGFLLTGQEAYLAPYRSALATMPGRLDALAELTADDAEQDDLARELRTAAGRKLQELGETVALERAGQGAQAMELVRSGYGEGQMDAVRSAAAALRASAERRLRDDAAALDRLMRGLMVASTAAIAAAILLAAYLIRDSRRTMARLVRRDVALRTLTATLEQRVIRRTRSLAEINQRFETALRASGVTVFTQDRDLVYTWISKDTLDRRASEFVGLTEQDVAPPGPREALLALKRGVIASGRADRAELEMEVRGERRWFDVTVEPLTDAAGEVMGVIGGAVDITDAKRREEHVRLLMHEVTHRSKNLLAVIQAIGRQTATHSASTADFVERFEARLRSMAHSHDLLVTENWQGATMRDVVVSQLGHYADMFGRQILLEGEPMRVSPEAAQHIGMALHELATNAAKYGALSVPDGRVRIGWETVRNAAGRQIRVLTWTENGGPEVSTPARRGFGRVVLERIAPRALHGTAVLTYGPAGVNWRLEFPAAAPVGGEMVGATT